MKSLVGILIGAVSALLYGLLSGYLLIQAEGQRAGAVVDLSNQVVAVIDPRFPIVPYLALAVAGLALLYCFALGGRESWVTRGALIGGFVMGIAIVAISWSIDMAYLASPQAFAVGMTGWLQFGGKNPALHLMVLIFAGYFIYSLRSDRSKSIDAPGAARDVAPGGDPSAREGGEELSA